MHTAHKRAHNFFHSFHFAHTLQSESITFWTITCERVPETINNTREKKTEGKKHQQRKRREMQRNLKEILNQKYKQTLSNTHFFSTIEKKNGFCCVSAYSVSNINFIFFLLSFYQPLLHMLWTLLVDKTHKIYLKKICLFLFSHSISLFLSFFVLSSIFLTLALSLSFCLALCTISCDIALNLSAQFLFSAHNFLWLLKLELMHFNDESVPISKLIKRKEFWMISLWCFNCFLTGNTKLWYISFE